MTPKGNQDDPGKQISKQKLSPQPTE